MNLRNLLVTIGIAAVLGACGGGSDPKSLCKKMFESRLEQFQISDAESKRAMFMDDCVQLDVEYLKCDAADTLSEKCVGAIKDHMAEQDALNTIIMTGKRPGQADEERAAAEQAKKDAIAARQAARGKDVCSQTCGAMRDVGFDPDADKTIKEEKACIAHCSELVKAGGDRKAFVDEIAVCASTDDMAELYTCIGKVNADWRKRAIDDPPQW